MSKSQIDIERDNWEDFVISNLTAIKDFLNSYRPDENIVTSSKLSTILRNSKLIDTKLSMKEAIKMIKQTYRKVIILNILK